MSEEITLYPSNWLYNAGVVEEWEKFYKKLQVL